MSTVPVFGVNIEEFSQNGTFGFWVIGEFKNIGSNIYEINSNYGKNDRSPYEIISDEWEYLSDDYEHYYEESNNMSEVIVQCKNDKGKRLLIIMQFIQSEIFDLISKNRQSPKLSD